VGTYGSTFQIHMPTRVPERTARPALCAYLRLAISVGRLRLDGMPPFEPRQSDTGLQPLSQTRATSDRVISKPRAIYSSTRPSGPPEMVADDQRRKRGDDLPDLRYLKDLTQAGVVLLAARPTAEHASWGCAILARTSRAACLKPRQIHSAPVGTPAKNATCLLLRMRITLPRRRVPR
jgi:hypothetical protein